MAIAPPPGTIDLTDDKEERANASLTEDTGSPVPPPKVADQRALKAAYGTPEFNQDILPAIQSGGEHAIRQSMAIRDGMEGERQKTALMAQIAAQNGGSLPPEAYSVLYTMSKTDFSSDPNDVFERKFSERFHTTALKVHENVYASPIQKALREDPDETLDLTDLAQHATLTREYAKKLQEDLHTEWQNTGWGSALGQYTGQFLPLLSAWNLHNVLQGPNTAKSILPGENLGQGIDHLLRLPYPEAKAKLKAAAGAVNKISTLDALTLVRAVVGYTSTESFLNNTVGITDVAGLAAVAGKGVFKATIGAADRISAARAARQRLKAPITPEDSAAAAVQEMQKEVGVIPATPPKIYYIPETAAKQLETVQMPAEGTVTGFKTAKGSEYTWDVSAASTTRNRAAREGDAKGTSTGPQPPSQKTYFITEEAFNDIRVQSGAPKRIIEMEGGRIGVSYKQSDGKWSIPYGSNVVDTQALPKEGLVPVEVWQKYPKNIHKTEIYGSSHFGNKITEVTRNTPEPVFWTDVKNGVSVQPGKAGEGMVPVSVDADGTIKFHPTQKGETYYLPPAAVRAMKGVQKFGRPVEYKASFNKDGTPVIWLDRKNKVFVEASKDPEGMPVSISKNGNIEFLMSGTMRDAQKAVRDHSKAVASPELKIEETLSQIGAHDQSATVKATKSIVQPKAEDLIASLPSGMNPTNFFGKGSALSQAWANKMVVKFTEDTQRLLNVLGKLDVSRLTPEATAVGIQETQKALKAIYGGRVNDGWIDFVHIPPELNPNKANLDTVIGRFGDLNARPFDSRAAAELYLKEIYKLSPGEATVAQQGNSYFIQVQKFIDETTEGVRKANITPQNRTPVSMVNMLLNRVRTSEDLLADFQRNNRHVATHAPQILNKFLREQIESTSSSLTKRQRGEVEDILRHNRDELNPSLGPNKRGNFYPTDAEFQQAFLDKFHHLPTEAQIAHYFNYVRVSDFDYTIRNLALYRDKGRLGLEQFSFSYKDAKGVVQNLPFFEGKDLEKFPWGGQNAGILIHDTDDTTRFLYKHGQDGTLDQTSRETVDKLIKERGFKVIQVFNPTERPFSAVDFPNGRIGEQIHFVVTNSSQRKALAFQQLEYRPGGHSIYLDDWYVKQPQLQIGQAGRLHYYGDNAVMNFATQAEAVKYAERMDRARLMLKNGEAGLEDYLARNLPYSVDAFKKMFDKGHLNLEHPIVHSKSGASTFDTVSGLKPEYRDMVDATKSEYNLAGSIDMSYTAERNLTLDTVIEKNGFFGIAPSRQLDPYEALNTGLGQAVRNLWMNDYKIQAVQQWIEEFGDVMKPRFKELSNNPMYFLYNPQWNEAVVDRARLAAAKTAQRAIVNFVGARSEIASQIQFLQNKLADTVYKTLGQTSSTFFADHLLPAIKNPDHYVRQVAFHSKLGLFNPIQLFVQMQSMANVFAIAGPTHSLPGFTGGFLLRRIAHTEERPIIERFADMAANLGWKRDDFLEMHDIFRKTGLYEVAGEAALRDDVFDPKLFRSTLGAWLDKGAFFFNEGERAVRLAAFATAYREFRAANPALKIGNREIGEIMSRSDTLSASMTRASAASWQNGILSIPTQFMTYNARIAEQFFSKRLTPLEKARMAGVYAAMYGVPTAGAAAAGVWPFYDDIKEEALKRGINLSDNYMKGLMEGIPSMVFSMATGKDYNFAQRWGPGGSPVFRDLIRGDKSFFETLGGPSASIIADIWGATQPAAKSLWYLVKGQSEDFPVRKEDWLAIINNSSTAALTTRIYTAIAYGKYISKNNVQVGDMDNMDAVMSILGVTPRHLTDTYLISKAGKEDQQVRKAWEDAAIKEFSLGLSALNRGDYEGYSAFMSRFNTYMNSGDFTIEDQNRIWEKVSRYQADLEDKVREEFWKRAPASKQQGRFDQFQTFFTNKGKQ